MIIFAHKIRNDDKENNKKNYEEESADSMCSDGLSDGLGTIKSVFHKRDYTRIVG